MISSSLTLVHVSPAADGAAVAIRERHVFVWQTDGLDEWGSPSTTAVLLLQLDQNWMTETHSVRKHVALDANSVNSVCRNKW